MSSWSKYTLSEKRTLLEQASEKTGVSDTIIEKDWWVTTLLKALSLSSCKGSFSFKGGTSLSKGWKLIRRFSEDIDIAIDKSFFGITQSNKNQRDKLRKNARTYIEQKLISELKNIIHSFGVNEFEINYVSAEDSIV
jgi:predicted nucleotidyltransferase component of viral defense system